MSVDVVARFAGTLLAARVVPAGASFRIGTAPEVDLPLPGFTSFPLVDETGLVRVPHGATAIRVERGERARLVDPMHLASADARVEIRIGQVEIVLARAAPRVAVPRPPIDRELGSYALAALLAHVALWAAALVVADPPPPPPKPKPMHLARIQPPRTPLPPPALPAGQHRAEPVLGRAEQNTVGGGPPRPHEMYVGSAAFADGMKRLMGPDLRAALADLGPAYDEDAVAAHDFGGRERRFDPTTKAGWGTIAAAHYKTVATGRSAGADYRLPGETAPGSGPVDVQICEGAPCVASGAIDAHAVTTWIAPRLDDLRSCFAREPAAAGAVTIAFTIAGSGAVHDMRARGLGKTGECAAAVVASIAFPRTARATYVRYPITFRRAS